ncbi:PriCT-2 domain-containing protein [Thauera humireducens]|uniref:PriCT-2 domain-containing protein n=1 Tax=Thauera humireducens TaxID=1134435 RepID=UPI00311EA78E
MNDAPQNFATLGPQLRLQGFEPIPVAGKRPVINKWEDLDLSQDRINYWASNGKGDLNVGLRTSALAPIDVDIYDAEVSARVVAAARARFGDAPERVGMPPKALLLYAAIEPGTKITSPIWVSPDGREHRVEVLGIGQQFVAAGIHPDTHKPYTWNGDNIADLELWMLPAVRREVVADWINTELPALIPSDWVQKGAGSAGALAGSDDDVPWFQNRHDDVDLEALRWMLDQLPQDYCDDRDSWRNVIFAAHHQFHGTEEELEALEIVDEWSSKSVKYVTGVVPAIWENAHEQRGGGLITVGSIKTWLGEKWKSYLATRKVAASAAVVVEAGWRERIASADAVTLKGPLAAEIRAAKLEKIDRETLVKHVQRRLAALEGVSPSIAAVRDLLAAPRVVELPTDAPDVDDGLAMVPDWARGWIWVRTDGKWLNRQTKLAVTKQAFDTEMQRHVADLTVQEGDALTTYEPSQRMFKHWGARAVDKDAYHPALGEIFTLGGVTYVNKYRPELRVVPAAAWTDEGRRMAQALERHLTLLVPDLRERQLLRAWLAHQYLHPGVKVRWAPLLKGCPGDGKSLLGELLELVLGIDNVKMMNADTIQSSPFSGWVEGQCVTVFEEVKFHGHNRYDVVNKLKPYIANNRVEKHGKGKDPSNILNVTNYLMLTNHEDAIPIEEGDRRYFVLFSPFRLLADLDALLQADYFISVAEHFEEVFSSVRENPAQLALWLSETEFPAEWDANMSAPMTAAKKVMVARSRTDVEEALAEILEDVATGSKVPGVGPTVVFVPYLRDEAMRRTDNRRSIGDKTVSACLREAGYLPLPGGEEGKARKVQWQGVQRSVWSKHGTDVSSDEVRRLLDATVADLDG